MPPANSAVRYGSVARALHRAAAALVALASALGLAATALPAEVAAAERASAFSAHKAASLAALAVILVRLAGAATQPRPVPLHPHRRWQTRTAAAVHARPRVGLAAVPATGLLLHAAAPGGAPLPWSFDRLPGLPLTEAAMARALPGAAAPALQPPGPATATATGSGDRRVAEARLTFAVRHMGAPVEGRLPALDARIRFDPARRDGTAGEVRVVIDMTRMSLGAWTEEARGPAFLDVPRHPEAIPAGTIRPDGSSWLAEGVLTLRGVAVPVALPFTLRPEGAGFAMSGAVRLDRRDFGTRQEDDQPLGWMADVAVWLIALPADLPQRQRFRLAPARCGGIRRAPSAIP